MSEDHDVVILGSGSTAFADWLKNLFANLVVFPIGAGAFMLSGVFANMANGASTQLWNPPLTSLVPSSTRSISALLAIGILFAIPSIAGGIKEAIKSKPFVSASSLPYSMKRFSGPPRTRRERSEYHSGFHAH